jgi:hypothetical protein
MGDIFKINGTEYECEFKLTNDDADKEIEFSKSAISSLSLEENLFMPFVNAKVVISNPFDYIEEKFSLRGDGNDKFEFSLKIKDAPNKDKLNYTFVVNKETNITDRYDRARNYKVYDLLDDKFYKLNSDIPYGKKYNGKVGAIIKSILKDVVGDDIIDEENWEDGDNIIDNFPMFIIPTVGYKYSDLLLYLLRIYYYKSDDIHVRGFLRFTRNKKYTLLPITKMFESHKDLLIEGFGVGDLAFDNKPNKNNPPPDAKVGKYTSLLKNSDLSTPGLEFSNEYFMNGYVSGYDPVLGEHGIREVRVQDLKDKWKKKFVDVFSSIGGKPKPFLVLNSKKKEEQFRCFSFPYNLEKSAKLVEAEMTSNFCFYNLQLNINNVGNSAREAGKFIDIWKADAADGEFDRKLLGRWLVTKVCHEFVAETYKNTFQCIKTYIGPGKEPKDDL